MSSTDDELLVPTIKEIEDRLISLEEDKAIANQEIKDLKEQNTSLVSEIFQLKNIIETLTKEQKEAIKFLNEKIDTNVEGLNEITKQMSESLTLADNTNERKIANQDFRIKLLESFRAGLINGPSDDNPTIYAKSITLRNRRGYYIDIFPTSDLGRLRLVHRNITSNPEGRWQYDIPVAGM